MVMTDDCCALMPEALSGIKAVFCLVDKEKVLKSMGWIQYFVLGLKWSLFALHYLQPWVGYDF